MDPGVTAAEIAAEISELPKPSATTIRRVRSAASKRLRDRPGSEIVEVANHLVHHHRWVAYELIYHHPEALSLVDDRLAVRLAGDFADWGGVDTFGRYISGPAWRRRQLTDELIASWTSSEDRWWRRAALVSTVPLNLRAAGGTGDPDRTLAVCQLLVRDRDDMVVKAMSWALRELTIWDPEAVRRFLRMNGDDLARRVHREVTNKLETGLKNP